MSYSSKYGKRASIKGGGASHSHIVNDQHVIEFIGKCAYPKDKTEISLDPALVVDVNYPENNPIDYIVAADGEYKTIPVKKTFPSSKISFFQFGNILIETAHLDEISKSAFISRESMSKLKELERNKLVLPVKNVSHEDALSLTDSIRNSVYTFFMHRDDKSSLMETLRWFLFREYDNARDNYQLSNCPHPSCSKTHIQLDRKVLGTEFKQNCPSCGKVLFLTDVFRLHERIDEETGAGGILGHLTEVIKQINIAHTIKNLLSIQPKLLNHFLFLKNGYLGFSGQPAPLHVPMRELCNYLFKNHNLFMAGLEKSGAFVEHADEIYSLLKPGQALLLSNKHIYSYILPGSPDNPEPYAGKSYYGGKVIFKSFEGRMHVITVPVKDRNVVLNPQTNDYYNLQVVLKNIERLRCDMHDNAIIPVALASKLISLSGHPSTKILEKFAIAGMK